MRWRLRSLQGVEPELAEPESAQVVTPGALLFHFASEPQSGLGGEPPVAHVAISLGNGKTIEARGHDYGVGIFDARKIPSR